MTHSTNRRRWLVRAAMAAGAWKKAPPVAAVDYSKPVPGSENLTAQQSQGLMLFRWNNRALAAYRARTHRRNILISTR